MRFATYEGEKRLSGLVSRLYTVEGPQAKEVSKAAEEALVKANPELANLAELEPGFAIVVPEVSGAQPAEETVSAEAAAGTLVVAELRRALDAAMGSLDESVERRTVEANATIDLVRSSNVRKLGREVPELGERLAAASDAAKVRLKEADTLRDYRDRALEELHADLDELAKLLG